MKRYYFYIFISAWLLTDAAFAQTRGRRGESSEPSGSTQSTPPVRRSEPVSAPSNQEDTRGRGSRGNNNGNNSNTTTSTPPRVSDRTIDWERSGRGNGNGNGNNDRSNPSNPRANPTPSNPRPNPTPPVDAGRGSRGGNNNDRNNDRTTDRNSRNNGSYGNNDRNNDRNNGNNDNNRNNDHKNDRDNDRDRYGNNRDRDRVANGRSASYYSRPRYTPPHNAYNRYDYGWMNWSRPIWVDNSRYSWSSAYVFKQYVYVDNGWNYNGSELEIRTKIRQNTRRNSSSFAQADFNIEGIELYQDGYFLGRVNYIPNYLGRVTASLSPSGNISFNNMLYLVGDPERGFEIVNSRYYNSYLMSRLFGDRGARVGYLDLDNGRVREMSYSHFLGDGNYRNNTMIPLVPENDDWGFGYTVAGFGYNDDWYSRNGGYRDYDNNRYYRNGNDRPSNDPYYRSNSSSAQMRQNVAPGSSNMYRNGNQETLRTEAGSNVQFRRRVEIEKQN